MTRSLTQSLLLIILSVNLVDFSSGQDSSRKFDEISDLGEQFDLRESEIEKRIQRFADFSKREKSLVPYVLHYRARVQQPMMRKASNFAGGMRWRIDNELLLVLDGGVRDKETLEFWFRPRIGDLPKPAPQYEMSETIDCPSIGVYREDLNFDKSLPIVFKSFSHPVIDSKLKWTVNHGVILDSTNPKLVKVDVSKAKSDRVSISVEFTGLPTECNSFAFASAEIGAKPLLLDSFGRAPNGDIRGRLDNFLSTLAQNPNLAGYVYVYGSRADGKASVTARHRLVVNHFLFRRFDIKRITMVDAGYREEMSTDLWLVPAGGSVPVATPTVDARYVSTGALSRNPKR